MRSSPLRSIGVNTGSNGLLYGLVAALAAVAVVVGIAGFDLTRPAPHSLFQKSHYPPETSKPA